MNARIFVATLIFACAAPVMAAEEEAPASAWAGKASLGYLATSGNTDNSNLNTAFEISYTAGQWVHFLDAAAIYADEDSDTTAEAYAVGWKSERKLSDANFLFGRLDWRKDRFSGYEEQFSQTVGYGRRLIDNERHSLNGEIGVGARQSELVDPLGLGNGETESETILTGGLYYKWALSETAEFTKDFLAESGSENTYFESNTALSAKLVGNLALVVSYTIKNNSDVPPGTEKTDTFTALSLEYSF
jgi:putative salt-induced outer membrane protein